MRTLRMLALLSCAITACGDDGDAGENIFGGDGSAADGDLWDSDGDSASSGDGQSAEDRPAPVEGPDSLDLPEKVLDLGAVIPPCTLPSSPAASCASEGAHEPNDLDAPLLGTLSDGCYQLSSSVAPDDDSDAVRWTNPRHDPVRVGVSYTATADVGNDINFEVTDATDLQQALEQASRSTLSEEEEAIFQAEASGIYTLNPYSYGEADSCQPYALYIDTRWCTDELEDNDEQTAASELDLSDNTGYHIEANISAGDDDFVRFVPPRLDPVLVELHYTAADGETTDIDFAIYSRQGDELLRDETTRSQADETVAYWIRPHEADTVYAVQLYAWGTGCAPYTLEVDANACTDSYEDNDEPAAATPLALNETLTASVLDSDPDYYDVSALGGALECVLSFDVVQGNEVIALHALDADGNEVRSNASDGGGDTQTAFVRLEAGSASTLWVEATEDAGSCLLYHLRCTPR